MECTTPCEEIGDIDISGMICVQKLKAVTSTQVSGSIHHLDVFLLTVSIWAPRRMKAMIRTQKHVVPVATRRSVAVQNCSLENIGLYRGSSCRCGFLKRKTSENPIFKSLPLKGYV